jgi:hypothetical protein
MKHEQHYSSQVYVILLSISENNLIKWLEAGLEVMIMVRLSPQDLHPHQQVADGDSRKDEQIRLNRPRNI